MANQKIWTHQLSGSQLIIDSSFALTQVSVLCGTGNTTIQGNAELNGIPSDPISLTQGQSVTFGLPTNINVIDYLDIQASGRTQITGVQ